MSENFMFTLVHTQLTMYAAQQDKHQSITSTPVDYIKRQQASTASVCDAALGACLMYTLWQSTFDTKCQCPTSYGTQCYCLTMRRVSLPYVLQTSFQACYTIDLQATQMECKGFWWP